MGGLALLRRVRWTAVRLHCPVSSPVHVRMHPCVVAATCLGSVAPVTTAGPAPLPRTCTVTRAEAGQRKRLLLLDRAAGWEAVDQLPLEIGPRYFVAAAARVAAPADPAEAAAAAAAEGAASLDGEAAAAGEAASADEAASAAQYELELPEGLRRGDRLLLTLPATAAKQHAKQLRKLEKQGAWGRGWQLGLAVGVHCLVCSA